MYIELESEQQRAQDAREQREKPVMRLTLDSTERHALINGVLCRVWIGQTRAGAPVVAYIHRIAIADDEASEQQLARELRTMEAVSVEGTTGKGTD